MMIKRVFFSHTNFGDSSMHTNSKTSSSYLIMYILSVSFFINRIMTRYIFENVGKLGWLIILAVSLLIFLCCPFIYQGIRKIQLKKVKGHLNIISNLSLYLYLISSSIIVLIFLSTLINVNWLKETRYIFILLPLLGGLYYLNIYPKDVFLRLATLFSFPILFQYLIFIFSKNKSFDLYALIPFKITIDKPYIIVITLIHMVLQMFTILLYIDDNEQIITKKQYYLSCLIIVFSLIVDSIIITGQFGNTISFFPFIYYESWCLLTFGQYIGYLDIFSFFYWITSSFCFMGLNMYLTSKYFPKRYYQLSYLLILLITLYILTHGIYYHIVKPILLLLCTLCLLLSIVGKYKELSKNET